LQIRVFRELGLIEQWGSGVKRIFKEAEELGLPELQIIELGMRLRVIVPLLKPIVLREDKSPKPSGAESGAESNMTMRIIAMLEEKPLAKLEIANCLGKEKPTRYLNELMRKLLNEDLVEYTLPEIPKSRLQKYRLTRKGEKLLGMDEEGREKIS
jgi:ATP-dependent DNA helicase RecG